MGTLTPSSSSHSWGLERRGECRMRPVEEEEKKEEEEGKAKEGEEEERRKKEARNGASEENGKSGLAGKGKSAGNPSSVSDAEKAGKSGDGTLQNKAGGARMGTFRRLWHF